MKNVAVIGIGNIGNVHCSVVTNSELVNLYAICDIDESKMELDEYVNVKKVKDYADVLSDPKIDAVHICTPHYLHFEMAVQAMESGKDVVLEKPICMNSDEIQKLIDKKNETNTNVCVMLQNRYNRCIIKLKELVEDTKATGKLLGVLGCLTWFRDEKYYSEAPWRGKFSTAGGGLIINQAVHLVDLLSYFGGEIEKIQISKSNKLLDFVEVEDTADACVVFKNGARGLFYATNTYTVNSPYRLELEFENIRYRYADNVLYQIKEDDIEIICKDDTIMQNGKVYWGNGHDVLINRFYAAIEEKTKDYVTLEDSAMAMKTMLQFYN